MYQVNLPIRVRYRALGAESGITDLQMIVTDPTGSDSSPITMTELGSSGIYEATFTPTSAGRWWVRISSASKPGNAYAKSFEVTQTGRSAIIIVDSEGNEADVTPGGRLKVSQEPPTPPPNTTPVNRTFYTNMVGTQVDTYTIPSGVTLHIQRLSAGAEHSRDGSVVELWYDPDGTGTNAEIIDVLFVNGTSEQHDLNAEYVGDGSAAILLVRRRLDGGSRRIFARWEGYY